ncbi:endonuclease MutS2 [Paracidobacterium acidisoli]|uniref:Endonuclease MutS2 n=1 Tax=Paracidobacterium acidisoli TaxID=2303751 RepID=A0A372IMM8_9BACT|nr:Smr/MutS family protein [Paracidobacterium acidisoli]MBT9331858.1 Smr/MutS family protein [Paracidobacterium acidisoli]
MSLIASISQPVPELSRTALEWDRFLEFLAGYAQSRVGREWVLALAPSTDRAWLGRQHRLAEEMRLLVREGVRVGLGSLFDPSNRLAKARIEGAALEAAEIRGLLDLAEDIAGWAAVVKAPPDAMNGRMPELTTVSAELMTIDLRPLVEAMRAKILPDGSLTDDASPELRRLRREMERQQRAIEDSLRSALRRFSEGGSTQEDLITIRGERFVIPVKAEWKRRAQGVVHGASSSGQTVYVEPLETIELNNELVRLLEEEQAEIHRIFLQMTRQIAQYAGPILAGAKVLAEVDTLQARARFAEEYGCVRPKFEEPAGETTHVRTDGHGAPEFAAASGFAGSGETHARRSGHGAPKDSSVSEEFLMKRGRHPLLERRLRAQSHVRTSGQGAPAPGTIVPLSISLENEQRQLIISGPNTGGKTVALKTAGLLAMMAQAGIAVPAEELVLPVFDAFLADIGDAQSIEQNLSTFSAHVVNLNRIAASASQDSLVLLDELGSATDPEEGAALAVAIAEHFLRAGAWSVISTHLTSLKVYAENTPGVVNAAVGFDEKTLAPTYELRQGVPGASAGINIAQRLGLHAEIVAAARAQLSTQTLDIGRFLDQLHEQLKAAGEERARVQTLEAELTRERTRLQAEGLKEWRAKVRELEAQLESLLKDFAYQARETVRAVEDKVQQQKLSKDAERRIARLRREFAETFNTAVVAQHTGADKGDRHAQPHVVRHVAEGDTVRLRTLGKTGTVLRQIDDKTFEVAVGPMKMRVARDEIAEVVRSAQAAATPLQAVRSRKGISVQVAEPDAAVSWEINVIGRTADEAQDEVEKFLDKAFLAGLPRIRIIHGTGMGVLRRTLRAWLERHPQVASVTEPGQNEGGAGATVVELRE